MRSEAWTTTVRGLSLDPDEAKRAEAGPGLYGVREEGRRVTLAQVMGDLVSAVIHAVQELGFHGLRAWDETVRICEERLRAAEQAYKQSMQVHENRTERLRLHDSVRRWREAFLVADTCRRQHLRMRLAVIESQLRRSGREVRSPDED